MQKVQSARAAGKAEFAVYIKNRVEENHGPGSLLNHKMRPLTSQIRNTDNRK